MKIKLQFQHQKITRYNGTPVMEGGIDKVFDIEVSISMKELAKLESQMNRDFYGNEPRLMPRVQETQLTFLGLDNA